MPTTDERRWVLGEGPWVLSLDGYPNEARAQRAVAWQRIGQGEFERWDIVTTDELRALLPTMDRGPYTEEAWAAFLQRMEN